jgi:hypothetical protein
LEVGGARQDLRMKNLEDLIRRMQEQIDELLQASGAGIASEIAQPLPPVPESINTGVKSLEDSFSKLQASQYDISTKVADVLPRLGMLEVAVRRDKKTQQRQTEDAGEGGPGGVESSEEKLTHVLDSTLLSKMNEHKYALRESIWDVSLFIGTNALGHGAALVIALDLLMQILMVIIFIGIIILNFANADNYTDSVKAQARKWRYDISHWMEFSDPSTANSLTARVCAQDNSLEGSANQFNIVGNLQAYLPAPDCETFECDAQNFLFTGPMLSIMVILVWHLTCYAEVNNAIQMFRGIFLCKSGRTLLVVENEEIRVVRMSPLRKVSGYFIVLLKFGLDLSLLTSGTVFLAHTVNLQNLLLNALALQFVLDLDMMVYDALAPISTCFG